MSLSVQQIICSGWMRTKSKPSARDCFCVFELNKYFSIPFVLPRTVPFKQNQLGGNEDLIKSNYRQETETSFFYLTIRIKSFHLMKNEMPR